ncbi:MAG: prolipoprotein diacylglyceryl transferase [Planctomycetota bacterium]
MLADAFLHQIDPFVFRITDTFGLRWYGTSYLAGLIVGWLVLRWLAKSGRCAFPVPQVTDFLFMVFAGVLIGGRVGYCAFYDPSLFLDFTSSLPFWGVFRLNKGGMASHGGMIGVIIAAIWFCKKNKINPLHGIDMVGFIVPAGLCFGRIANFINGELWGRPLADDMQADAPSWSMKFPKAILDWDKADLPRLADTANTIGIEPVMWNAMVNTLPDDLAAPDAVITDVDSFRQIRSALNEMVAIAYDPAHAAHGAVSEALAGALYARYPSPLIQAAAEGPILALMLVMVWWKPRRAGVITAWFLMLYGVLRIVTEQFREPDRGISLLFGSITRGQTLSAAMILAGAAVLVFAMKRPPNAFGGLVKKVEPSS